MRGGNVAHVKANRAVSEHREFVPSTQNAFLNGFGCLVSAVELFHALHLHGEPVNAQTDSGVFNHLVHSDGLDFTAAIGVGASGVGRGSPVAWFTGFRRRERQRPGDGNEGTAILFHTPCTCGDRVEPVSFVCQWRCSTGADFRRGVRWGKGSESSGS